MFACCLHHDDTEKTHKVPWKNGARPKKIPFKDMSILILGQKKSEILLQKNTLVPTGLFKNSCEISRSRSEVGSSCTLTFGSRFGFESKYHSISFHTTKKQAL